MATYYADFDLGTGNNTGVDWTHAWKTFADAIAGSNGTIPAAGDTVKCRGTETAACTNTLVGTEAAGMIHWIGVDASGNNVGGTTRCIIDAGGANQIPLTQTGSYNFYENFAFCNSGNNDGVEGAGDNNVYVNCAFYGNATQYGYNGSGMDNCWMIRCVSYGNEHGYYAGPNSRMLFCCARDNDTHGFVGTAGGSAVLIGCISYDNVAGMGYYNIYYAVLMFNCVSDGNGDDGVSIRSTTSYVNGIFGCRITNHAGAGDIGLNCNAELVLYGWNYFENNANANVQGEVNAGKLAITLNGAATNIEDQANTLQGYTDDDPEDFNLASDASLRRSAITIPTS